MEYEFKRVYATKLMSKNTSSEENLSSEEYVTHNFSASTLRDRITEAVSTKLGKAEKKIENETIDRAYTVISGLISKCNELNDKLNNLRKTNSTMDIRSFINDLQDFGSKISNLELSHLGIKRDNFDQHDAAVAIVRIVLDENTSIKSIFQLETKIDKAKRQTPTSIYDLLNGNVGVETMIKDQLLGNHHVNYAMLGIGSSKKEVLDALRYAEDSYNSFKSSKGANDIDSIGFIELLNLYDKTNNTYEILGFSPYYIPASRDFADILECVNAVHFDNKAATALAETIKSKFSEKEKALKEQQPGAKVIITPVDIAQGLILQAAGFDISETLEAAITKNYQDQTREKLKQTRDITTDVDAKVTAEPQKPAPQDNKNTRTPSSTRKTRFIPTPAPTPSKPTTSISTGEDIDKKVEKSSDVEDDKILEQLLEEPIPSDDETTEIPTFANDIGENLAQQLEEQEAKEQEAIANGKKPKRKRKVAPKYEGSGIKNEKTPEQVQEDKNALLKYINDRCFGDLSDVIWWKVKEYPVFSFKAAIAHSKELKDKFRDTALKIASICYDDAENELKTKIENATEKNKEELNEELTNIKKIYVEFELEKFKPQNVAACAETTDDETTNSTTQQEEPVVEETSAKQKEPKDESPSEDSSKEAIGKEKDDTSDSSREWSEFLLSEAELYHNYSFLPEAELYQAVINQIVTRTNDSRVWKNKSTINKTHCQLLNKLLQIADGRFELANKDSYLELLNEKSSKRRYARNNDPITYLLPYLDKFVLDKELPLPDELISIFELETRLIDKCLRIDSQKIVPDVNNDTIPTQEPIEQESITQSDKGIAQEPTIEFTEPEEGLEQEPDKILDTQPIEPAELEPKSDMTISDLLIAALNYLEDEFNFKKVTSAFVGNFVLSLTKGISFDKLVLETARMSAEISSPDEKTQQEIKAGPTQITDSSDFVQTILSKLDDIADCFRDTGNIDSITASCWLYRRE